MRPLASLFGVMALGFMASAPLAPAFSADTPFTDSQKSEIETIIRKMLTEKEPELVFEAAKFAEAKLAKETAVKSVEGIAKFKDKIFKDAKSPVGGNVKAETAIVEFFDYNCGYCKQVNVNMVKFVAADKNTKIIYKEYPILGEVSVTAAKAALASVKQGKYEAFHNALMTSKERLSEKVIFDVAKSVNLDVEKLKKTMADDADEMKKIFTENAELAHNIGISGTPGFIIGNKMIPGALPEEGFKAAVEDARKSEKK